MKVGHFPWSDQQTCLCHTLLEEILFWLPEPLYIIVEYCEYGSLRHYLRSCRHNNALSMEGQDISSGQSKALTKYSLSTRELLSFAWQIAKGMHYLAEMKVKRVTD